MFNLLIVLLIVICGVLLVEAINSPVNDIIEVCVLHKWEYDHLGQMVCNKCNYKP